MPDDSNDLSITELLDRANSEGTPFADVVAQLPNPTQTIDPAKAVEEPAPVVAPKEEVLAASADEVQVDTETPAEQPEIKKSITQDDLFNELRAKFPNESLVDIAARVEAAFSAESVNSNTGNTPDVMAEIQSEYEGLVQAAKEAEDHVKSLLHPDDGTIAEYTEEIRDAERASMKASLAAENAFKALAQEANEAAAIEFPELDDVTSQAYNTLAGVLEENPGLADSSPVALANMGRKIASRIRASSPAHTEQKTFASPTRVPAPAGPKPPVAALSSTAQAPHAPATTPNPGTPTKPNLANDFLASGMSVNDFFNQTIGGSSMGVLAS